MSGKKGMRHYPAEVKLEAVRLFQAGKTHGEITQALGIRDLTRTEKWIRAYRAKGAAAFHKSSQKGLVGRPPKKENPQAYLARLEMEVALLKKFHTELRNEQLAKRNIGRSTTTGPSTQ
jgi:transposase-like protein